MNKARWCCFACAGLLDVALLSPGPAEAGWPTDPLVNGPLCTATDNPNIPAIASDRAVGAIVAWVDNRGGNCGIYARRVQANGQLGGALTVRFALGGAEAASLELVEIAGRRLVVREVGSWGAGRHTLDLGADRRLAPGLFLVRSRQGADARVIRVVVLSQRPRSDSRGGAPAPDRYQIRGMRR